ncbi:NAD(P)-dependent oxidoreductase [Phytoactinopolyspora halotolerans]|uniref:NAD(P)-dependent oxidoreductase n=1 Tax=Phytoactinopolyspora halotolerans TaxID=1981512 RepID=A0A6L9S8R1_9ACTN|nr:NAD(P)-binding domain-containing protein [Phytoactinopolyspora halotolerans]NEE01457.1 NAD(P)-dependent oxidoreductase [Phytoactinopolyspora halotolerans]
MTEHTPVTVLGLGPMGTALASAFVRAGHRTTVWNRTAGKAAPLVEKGAVAPGSAADAVAASPLTVVCVIDYDAVRAIVEPVAESLRGKTLVNLTADTPDRARELAAWAAERGIDYIDGAIMTPTVTIGGPDAVFLYSGPEQVYESNRSTLASLGGTGAHVGTDPGRAAAYDVALLDTFWTAMSGVVHALALAEAEGIAGAEIAERMQGILALAGQLTPELASDVDRGSYPGDDSTIVSNAAGMEHIIHAARSRDIDPSVLEAAKAVADRAIKDGHGQDGFSRLADTLRRTDT